MQHHNPLCAAVQIHNSLLDAECSLMFEIGGDAAFEPFDEELSHDICDLIDRSSNAVASLSPRARHARLNLIWKDFVVNQKQKRAPQNENRTTA